jgi:hypothetical protein
MLRNTLLISLFLVMMQARFSPLAQFISMEIRSRMGHLDGCTNDGVFHGHQWWIHEIATIVVCLES